MSFLRDSVDAHVMQMVRFVLSENGGNRTAAAERLGISRTNLQHYIKKFGLSEEYPPSRSGGVNSRRLP
jgi:transcriptional regulator with PAS, ATPase and Fis domain